MKKLTLFFLGWLMALSLCAQTIGMQPFGYGASATGGGSATPTLVSTLSELTSALSSKPKNKVIIITKDITLTGVIQVKDGANLTILGLPGVKLYNPNWQASLADANKITGIFEFTRIDNLIVRNIIFEGGGAYDCDGRDHITLESVTNAWIDHCDFQDAVDDCLDIKKLSDNITISWCKFHYEKAYHPNGPGDASGDKDHRFVSLLGSSSSDKPSDGTYNITYAYLWFGDNCMQRMIRCRNAEPHFLGCYWNSANASYYIGPENVSAYIELCTFEGGPKSSNIYKAYNSTKNPVKFVNTTSKNGLPSEYGTVSAPSYSYQKYSSAAEAKTAVTSESCGAGATLIVTTSGAVSSGCSASATQYTITFNSNGGSGSMSQQKGYEGANTTINACTFTAPSGKTFAGWKTGASSGTSYADQGTITLTSNVTLYAQWASAYTVTFNANGHGTAPSSQTVVSGGKATEPTNPSADGWAFGGWYTESSCTNKFDFNTTITGNKTLYAKWTEKVCEEQVWYHSLPSGASQATCFTFAAAPTGGSACDVTMTIDGTEYTAEKRSSDWNSTFTFTIPSGKTGVFYIAAKSSSTSGTRTLTFTKDGAAVATLGVLALQSYNTESLEAGTYTVSTNGNTHIAMMGLQLCGSSQVITTKTYYDVTFNANGHGTAPTTQSVIENGLASEPTAPTASGYVFGGWYKEAACTNAWNFSTDLVTKATTLYAKWTAAVANKVTVTFNANGHGTAPTAQSINSGATATEPTAPTATNYEFGGWYDNANCEGDAWDFSTPISANTTLYAKWTEVLNSGWVLTGELDGEFMRNAGDASSKAYLTLHLNANTTYEFNLEKNGGNTFTYSTIITGTQSNLSFTTGTAVAQIKSTVTGDYEFTVDYSSASAPKISVSYPASVTVTFNANGHGTAPATQTLALNGTATKPADLTASGYIFGGWYTEAACTNAWNFSTAVSANMTLYAKWTEAGSSTNNCWSWTEAATLTATTDYNGLSAVANSTGNIVIDANTKTIGDKYFTHRLKLGGTGSSDYRHLILPVSGSCAISIYAFSSSGSADRTLTLRSGSFSGTEIGTASAPGANGAKTTINYTGGATNIYIYSPSSGVNVYGICVDYSGAASETYTITYNNNGHGTVPATVSNATALPSTLPTMSENGYTFDGWYTNSGLTIKAVAGATISQNTTLYAKWTQNATTGGFTISYNMNGYGMAISDVTNATALPNPLPTPTATGYTFGGWYTNSGLTSAATAGAAISQNTMLYAKWTAVETPVQPSTSDLYGGWFESCWMEFGATAGASEYVGYVSANSGATWTKLDKELVRWYPNGYGRVDAVGLKAGNYMLKIVPVIGGTEDCSNATVSGNLVVKAHDRTGFAHTGTYASTGVGAYKNDGTLKDNARVLYVTAATAKTVSLSMKTSSSAETELTGLQAILGAYEKAQETRPLAVRIIGTITAADMDALNSSEEGLQVKGKGYTPLNLTIEGIGKDAAIKDFGILNRGVTSVEYRNFAILNCMDDCLGMDTKNSNMWIHNIDFYYGQAGSAADQVKGDGTVDLKGDSKWITISYNHFYDSGKMSLCGMKSETGPNYITYHHNHFDHSDSRHPRIRTMSVHIFNNYYDGNAKYGVGACMGSSAFVEGNYFRACSKPMMSSMQGTDIANGTANATFSSENGGIIKAYNNYFATTVSYITYQTNSTSFDAYEVANRADKVPSSVVTLQGATTYDNFDTEYENMYSVTLDDPQNVPTIVLGTYGAGRCQHGDLNFQFSTADDADYKVNTTLKSQVTNYTSSWGGNICGNTTASACSSSSTGYNVIAQVSPAGYGEVSKNAILDVAKGTSISANGSTLTVGSQTITATAATASAEYTYAFSKWSWTPSGSTISATTTATAEFTRTPKKYTLTWDENGGNALSGTYTSGTIDYGTTITQPATPTRTGYTFTGWSPTPASTMPAANTTYTAQWKDNSVTGYTITYSTDGGSAVAQATDQTALPNPLPTTTKDGYTFDGWYTDSNLSFAATAGATISANTTLYAKWTQNAAPATGGYVCNFIEGKPSSDFYTVSGNYNSVAFSYCETSYARGLKLESSTSLSFTLTEAKTLYFIFNNSATSKIDGSVVTPDKNYVVTAALSAGTHTLTKANSTVLYLITDTPCGGSSDPEPTKYTIRFLNGSTVLQSGDVAVDETPAYTGATPTKTATATTEYTFSGWSPAIAAVSKAQDYVAQFTETPVKYTLTWDLDGGTITTAGTAAGSVANGTALTAPVVTKDGYTFNGWNPTVAATMPAANTTYTATWKENTTPVDPETIVLHSLTSGIGTAEAGAENATVNAGTSYVLSGGTGRIKLTPKTGEVFKNGDKVSFTGKTGSDGKTVGIKV